MYQIPYFKITPLYAVSYFLPDCYCYTDKQKENAINLRANKQYLSDISEKSKKKLMYYFSVLWLISKENILLARKVVEKTVDDEIKKVLGERYKKPIKFRLVFITLTLSSKQVHSDKVIKSKLLKDFLDRMRKKWNTQLYIWKAEKQKNGNIHFHIVTNRFIPHKWIKQTWNKIQEKLGYITEFEKKHGHRDPNSTDIHAVYKIKNVNAYLGKYVSKFLTDISESDEVKSILSEIRKIDTEIYKLTNSNDINLDFDELSNKLTILRLQKDQKLNELEKYKDKLVDGRIWDASITLKKLAPFWDAGYFDHLDIVEKDKENIETKRLDKGNDDVIILHLYQLDKTPHIKNFLINYYSDRILKLDKSSIFSLLK